MKKYKFKKYHFKKYRFAPAALSPIAIVSIVSACVTVVTTIVLYVTGVIPDFLNILPKKSSDPNIVINIPSSGATGATGATETESVTTTGTNDNKKSTNPVTRAKYTPSQIKEILSKIYFGTTWTQLTPTQKKNIENSIQIIDTYKRTKETYQTNDSDDSNDFTIIFPYILGQNYGNLHKIADWAKDNNIKIQFTPETKTEFTEKINKNPDPVPDTDPETQPEPLTQTPTEQNTTPTNPSIPDKRTSLTCNSPNFSITWTKESDPQTNFNTDMLNITNYIRKLWWNTDNYNLTLDDNLTDKAQAWACHLAHNVGAMQHGTYADPVPTGCPPTDGTILSASQMNHGQNIAFNGCQGNCASQTLGTAKFAVKGWLIECEDCDVSNSRRCTVTANPGKMVGHFTQLIWRSAKKLGVGRAIITEGNITKVFIVCNYDVGNVKRNKDYWYDETNMPEGTQITKLCPGIVSCLDNL